MFGEARSVPVFVVIADIRHDVLAAGDVFQHVAAACGVALVLSLFRAVEVGHLGQQGIGHEKQADVMQEGCIFDLFDFTLGQRQFGSDADTVVGDL